MDKFLLHGHHTDRLLLRKFTRADFDAWLPFFRDPESTRYWEGIPDDPLKACRQQFDRIFERYEKGLGGMNALACRRSGDLMGMCGLLVQDVDGDKELEIGYSLLPEARGKGYATEAGLYCRDAAFARGWSESLISIIHIRNLPSQSVAKRLGMTRDRETRYKENPVVLFRVHRLEVLPARK